MLAGSRFVPCAAQQAAAAPPPLAAVTMAQAREALRKAEAEHPGDSKEVAAALEQLITAQRDTETVDAATLPLIDREMKIQLALAGPRSKEYMYLLQVKADVLVGLSRAPEARPLVEQALEIGQKEFPDSQDTATAAGSLGRTCSTLGDFPCALRAQNVSVDMARKANASDGMDLMAALNNLGALKARMNDFEGAIKAQEESLTIAYRLYPNDNHMGVIENNLGSNYMKAGDYGKAAAHLDRAISMLSQVYGAESPRLMQVNRNRARLYAKSGQFPLAWKAFEFSLKNNYEQVDARAASLALYAQSLAQGGDDKRAIEEGLASAKMSREIFTLQARTLPERQALAYDATRPHGVDTAISVLLRHRDLPIAETYQEVVRSRALVADEMAHRQKNLNANNDPEVARLLDQLNQARTALLAAEHLPATSDANAKAVIAANDKMEALERTLAEHSAALRSDERIRQVTLDDLRHNLPADSVLVSYVLYRRRAVDQLDAKDTETPSYMALVLHANASEVRLFDLGDAASLDALVSKARAAADAEAHSGGLGSTRNERSYREAALALRSRVWDPLRTEIGASHHALVVADGNLNLIPFASLPDGTGYLVEHGPVIHMLSSERDVVPLTTGEKKRGLLAVGSPTFELAANTPAPALRGATPACEEFDKIEFRPLPESAVEVADIASTWRRWNRTEPTQTVMGNDATLARFLSDASHNRVLHVATHAFLLEKRCGSGNPLLDAGLVFAGGLHGGPDTVLTAQQIASLDLGGVDWAVLSACNTGNGELHDGEGVLGLQRAFRVAGARSVIMSLWPVDDDATRRFMHQLYAARLEHHASTADAVWNSSRTLLLARRAAGQSTHPWYWAGFVGSGAWE